MPIEYKDKMGIPKDHILKKTFVSWGTDTEVSLYDHFDEKGHFVDKYVVRDSMSDAPPFERSIDWQRI